ncbi:hypothetical protein [Streptomyces sp. S584]|uniref:hypothetical protein n=1 Tax=Streptomyces sp. S584 TaxID=3096010 RepID=UPI002B002091|nr:hypothetical protein [Streptomyces sp. S584]
MEQLRRLSDVDQVTPRHGLLIWAAQGRRGPGAGDGKIAYAKLWYEDDGPKLGVEVLDTVKGTRTLMPMDKNTTLGVGQTAITDDGVFWIEDVDGTDTGQAAVRRADLGGANAVTVARRREKTPSTPTR